MVDIENKKLGFAYNYEFKGWFYENLKSSKFYVFTSFAHDIQLKLVKIVHGYDKVSKILPNLINFD